MDNCGFVYEECCNIRLNAGQFQVKPKKFPAPLQMVYAGH